MTPRTKNRLLKLLLLVLAAGGLWLAVQSAPPRDDGPALLDVLARLDAGDAMGALDHSALRDTWDLPGMMYHARARRAQLGRALRVEWSGPAEPVPAGVAGPGPVEQRERRRMKVAFEKGVVEGTFTFAQRAARWLVQDWDLPLAAPPALTASAQAAEKAATQLLALVSGMHWDQVHEALLRARRMTERVEVFRAEQAARFSGLGVVREVADRVFTREGTGGRISARLVYEQGERAVSLSVAYAPDEGRFLITQLDTGR